MARLRIDIHPRDSYAEARAFLEAIGQQGRRYYVSPQLVIDTVYPPLYAVSRGLALWWLTMPGRVREDPVPLKIRYALIAVPVLMASLDLFENGCIAVMLWTWPDLSHGLVEVSSLATQVKIIAGVLTEALMGEAIGSKEGGDEKTRGELLWSRKRHVVRRAHSTPQRNAETSSVLPPCPQALVLRRSPLRSCAHGR